MNRVSMKSGTRERRGMRKERSVTQIKKQSAYTIPLKTGFGKGRSPRTESWHQIWQYRSQRHPCKQFGGDHLITLVSRHNRKQHTGRQSQIEYAPLVLNCRLCVGWQARARTKWPWLCWADNQRRGRKKGKR